MLGGHPASSIAPTQLCCLVATQLAPFPPHPALLPGGKLLFASVFHEPVLCLLMNHSE